MTIYKAPLDDMRFILNEVLDISQLSKFDGYDMVDADTVNQFLDAAAQLSEEVIAPTNRTGDIEGCKFDPATNTVKTPTGFKEAYEHFVEGGWSTLACDPEYGGMGMPLALDNVIKEMFCSSNVSFSLYPGLSHGVYTSMHGFASDEIKDKYLPKLVSGEWTGSMCLTESICGTDLGLMRSKAKEQEDGSYKLTGEKIFISCGEHDLAGNIVHLVLAKIDDKDLPEDEKTPEGVKGISLFIVPKHKLDEAGEPGERNDVKCVGTEEKMGIHGSVTCTMQFDGAEGFLIGEKHKGLQAMFAMMNEERLAVGMQGLGLSEVAYQNALEYAQERLQGKSMTGRKGANSTDKADPLTVIPDVRRMLMTMKSTSEAARMMGAWVGMQLDIAEKHPEKEERQKAEGLIAFMTPIVKAHMTDLGFDNANMGMQIFGGHGFIEETGMAQFVRDSRIAQIYEGANGIQALDLIGRKVMQKDLVSVYLKEVDADLKAAKQHKELRPMVKEIEKTVRKLRRRNMLLKFNALTKKGELGDILGAASMDYLNMVSTISMAHMSMKMADKAQTALKDPSCEHQDFYQSKIKTTEFYIEKMLPRVYSLDKTIASGYKTLFSLEENHFAREQSTVAKQSRNIVNDNDTAKKKGFGLKKLWKK